MDATTGGGVTVGLLDSGVATSCPDLRDANVVARDFTNSGTTEDRTGHGTGSAALLVGQGAAHVRGLARSCTVLAAKVLARREREDEVRAIVRAISWCVREGADVLVLPLGSRVGSRALTAAIHHARSGGCLVFAAAGNRGPEKIQFPASMPEVVAVSGVRVGGAPWPDCPAGPSVDSFAPGEAIPTAGLRGAASLSGSSPATVLAAGLAVLTIAAGRRGGSDAVR